MIDRAKRRRSNSLSYYTVYVILMRLSLNISGGNSQRTLLFTVLRQCVIPSLIQPCRYVCTMSELNINVFDNMSSSQLLL